MRRASLAIAILVHAAVPALAEPSYSTRLDRSVVPLFEAIRLKIDTREPEYSGSARIDLRVQGKTDRFRVHAKGLRLHRLELYGPRGRIPTSSEARAGFIEVRAPRQLMRGTGYALEIDFARPFATGAAGLYRVDRAAVAYTFTAFEPAAARQAWPCFDEPSFKIPFQITVEVPEGVEAVSNAPIESERVEAGIKTVRFRSTPPIPSYLVTLATGPFEFVPIVGLSVPGRIVTTKGQASLMAGPLSMTPRILAALERYFDSRCPYEKLDLLAVPDSPGAMESPGAVTLSEETTLLSTAARRQDLRRNLERVIAHELAHMWFGDLVTINWWDDLWLKESFADWMSDKMIDELYPDHECRLIRQRGADSIMLSDVRPSVRSVRQPIEDARRALADVNLTYGKGKAILAMFESWIGPERFRQGVIDYLRAHAGATVRSSDFWTALSKVAGRNGARAMATFVEQPGIPIVTVAPLPGARIRLRQRRLSSWGTKYPPAALWRIPVTLRYGRAGVTHTMTVMLDQNEVVAKLPPGEPIEWVLPNAGGLGYYRWRVPRALLLMFAAEPERFMDARERVGFIGNASALLDARIIRGDDYLRLLKGFADDEESQVVLSLLANLDKIKLAFALDDLQVAFARYVRELLRPALVRVGLTKAAHEPESRSRLRANLIERLSDEGRDQRVRRHAFRQVQDYFKDRRLVDSSIVGAMLDAAAIDGSRELWEQYRRRMEAPMVPGERELFLRSLGGFRHPEIMEASLRYVLQGPLLPHEVLTLLRALNRTADGRARTFRWVTENYDAIEARLSGETHRLEVLLPAGCEPGLTEAGRAFLIGKAYHQPEVVAQIGGVVEQVTQCAELRRREATAVRDFLREREPLGQSE